MRKFILLIMFMFLVTGCNSKGGELIELQIEPSLIPSVLMVGESFDMNFSYVDEENLASQVEVSTNTSNTIKIENLKVTALKPGIAEIQIKYPSAVDPDDNNNIVFHSSTTQIFVYDKRVSSKIIDEMSMHTDFLQGGNVEELLEYRVENNSALLNYSDGGRMIMYESYSGMTIEEILDNNPNYYFFMTIGEIIDKNPEYTLKDFIINEIRFEYPNLIHLNGFNETFTETDEIKNWTDSGVKENLVHNVTYRCGTEEEIILDIEGRVKSKKSLDNGVCEKSDYRVFSNTE